MVVRSYDYIFEHEAREHEKRANIHVRSSLCLLFDTHTHVTTLSIHRCSLTRRGVVGGDSNYFRVVSLCEVVDSPSIERRLIRNDQENGATVETWIVPPELYLDRMLFVYKGDYFEGSMDMTSTKSDEFRRQCLSSLESRAI